MLVFALLGLPLTLTSVDGDLDSDRDGLSDFWEEHKYLTDPKRADSDGDGIPDGDWLERREYQYVVRSVVHVMKPATPDFLNDDYQDARVLDETDEHLELEVIHYPYPKPVEIRGDDKYASSARSQKHWLAPGPTSDASKKLGKAIERAMAEDGIVVSKLDDKELVEQASRWLCQHAVGHDGFSTFVTGIDARGKPFIPDELRDDRSDEELADQWSREFIASQMFEHGARGSCTSSAIYLTGCLRSLGIPTRTILCVPIIDANDPQEIELALGLGNRKLRRSILAAAKQRTGSWASHTFNEVFVGERWRRLNDSTLGQGIADPNLFGLITHVATFHDWADARMHETIGRRQTLDVYDDICGGRNPYSTIALRDEIGVHSSFSFEAVEASVLSLVELAWSHDESLPSNVVSGLDPKGRMGLVAVFDEVDSFEEFQSTLKLADPKLYFKNGGQTMGAGLRPDCWWLVDGRAYVWVPMHEDSRMRMRPSKPYAVTARNEQADDRILVAEGLVIAR